MNYCKVEDMESRDGEERPLGELGKDKDHGLWPQSGPSEKIWKGSLWHLPDRCWKNCYLLWWLLVLDPQKCSGIKGPLRPDPDFRCACCLRKALPIVFVFCFVFLLLPSINFCLFLGGVHCTLRCVCRMSLHA